LINIYGIFKDNKCLYIGETTRTYEERIKEHQSSLRLNKHSNKTLQRLYNECSGEGITYRLVDSVDAESSLLRFFYEGLYNSYYKPTCCKIIVQQGSARVSLSRCKQDKAKQIIECINMIYKDDKKKVEE